MLTTDVTTHLPAQFIFPAYWSLADLQNHLGVPAERIRAFPQPGTATEADVERIESSEGRLYELNNGVLVEKLVSVSGNEIAALSHSTASTRSCCRSVVGRKHQNGDGREIT